jgi:hypothetical protein
MIQMSSIPQKGFDNLNRTGSLNSDMAASKPELSISQLPGEKETKFQRLDLQSFSRSNNRMVLLQTLSTEPDLVNQIWRPPNRMYLYLSFQVR